MPLPSGAIHIGDGFYSIPGDTFDYQGNSFTSVGPWTRGDAEGRGNKRYKPAPCAPGEQSIMRFQFTIQANQEGGWNFDTNFSATDFDQLTLYIARPDGMVISSIGISGGSARGQPKNEWRSQTDWQNFINNFFYSGSQVWTGIFVWRKANGTYGRDNIWLDRFTPDAETSVQNTSEPITGTDDGGDTPGGGGSEEETGSGATGTVEGNCGPAGSHIDANWWSEIGDTTDIGVGDPKVNAVNWYLVDGVYKSGNIGDNQASIMRTRFDSPTGGGMTFRFNYSAESVYDLLHVCLRDTAGAKVLEHFIGNSSEALNTWIVDNSLASVPSAGTYEAVFTFWKNPSGTQGRDNVWIDSVQLVGGATYGCGDPVDPTDPGASKSYRLVYPVIGQIWPNPGIIRLEEIEPEEEP